MLGPATRRGAELLSRTSSRREPAGRRLPLASLRARAGTGSDAIEWKLEPDGVLGRVLEVEAGGTVSYPLALDGEVTLVARAMLYPHDWRDGRGAVRAVVTVDDADGGRRELWAATLHAGDRGRPGGHRLAVSVPAGTTALHLSVQPRRTQPPDGVERAIWVEPALFDPVGSAGEAAATPVEESPTVLPAGDGPLFSVLVPVHDPPPHMLAEAIESVRAQTCADWELCLVDDGSRDPEIRTMLDARAQEERIRLHRHAEPRGISAATNAALALASGRYVALLDHDDTLTPDALAQIALRIAADPTLDMVYTDEDIVHDGVVLEPHPKPGWSPEHMTALMYTCHLGVYRRTLVEELGGFRSRFDGCQDFDLVLRLMEHSDRVAHSPGIHYHWRAHPASTATIGGGAKPHAFLAQPPAIAEHLQRIGVDAEVEYGPLSGIHRIVHRVDPKASVGFALALTATDGLAAAARTWRVQPHPAWQLSVAAPAGLHNEIATILSSAGIEEDRIALTDPEADDPARALAHAAGIAADQADHVLLMQAPAAGRTHDWLTRLLGYSAQPGIAAVGPVLLSRDGRIHNAGIALPDGIALHLLQGLPAVSAPPAVTNVSAVSGVLLTPSATFHALGGLDPVHRELALVDYCLRARDEGDRIVNVPDARVILTGPDPTINDLPALRTLQRRWTAYHTHDPYYNPGYRTDRGDLAMR